jgi:hypothetical protein
VGGALREAELAVEEGEQVRVTQLEPDAAGVELRERDEELGEGGVLAAEEVGETGGEFIRGGHEGSIVPVFTGSWDARIRARTSDLRAGGGARRRGREDRGKRVYRGVEGVSEEYARRRARSAGRTSSVDRCDG